ncbi:hypothetical protein GCM10023324_64900 [Streptomyces youssoufiensis]
MLPYSRYRSATTKPCWAGPGGSRQFKASALLGEKCMQMRGAIYADTQKQEEPAPTISFYEQKNCEDHTCEREKGDEKQPPLCGSTLLHGPPQVGHYYPPS